MNRAELRAALQPRGMVKLVADLSGVSQSAVVRFKTKDIGSLEKLRDIAWAMPIAQQKWAAHQFETINDHAKPCPRGHTSRYYSSNACTVCYLQRQADRYRKRNQQK